MQRPTTSNRRMVRDERDIEKAKDAQSTGIDSSKVPVEKRYRVDPDFSREPTAICERTKLLGIPVEMVCDKGSNSHCYWRCACSSQIDLNGDGETLTPAAERLRKKEYDDAIKHSKEVWDQHQDPELSDANVDAMVRAILGR